VLSNNISPEDVRLNYNPEKPQGRFKAAGLKAALVENASDRLPSSVPWPAGKAPKPARNASDPQMPNPNHEIETANKAVAEIYAKYDAFTTEASVIASWAVIDAIIN